MTLENIFALANEAVALYLTKGDYSLVREVEKACTEAGFFFAEDDDRFCVEDDVFYLTCDN